MTQNEKLLAYLKTHRRGITQLEAFVELGICRLSERIAEIEGARFYYTGVGSQKWIDRDRVKVPTRDGKRVTVTRYSLTERT